MRIKHLLYKLFGKDPEAVVVSFLSGPAPLAVRMVEQIRDLVPDREHYAVSLDAESFEIPGVTCVPLSSLSRILRRKRIGLAPVLYSAIARYKPLRRAAWRRAPHKILAFNERLERHHLSPGSLISSWLFVRGVPLDRIFLRPGWLVPWKRDRSVFPTEAIVHDGRPLSAGRPRVAVLSPYFPYPLSHGGAVRIFHMLREAARDFDVFLFSFAGVIDAADLPPILALCAKVAIVPNNRYREPRWSTLEPPEVPEFRSPVMKRLLAEIRSEYDIPVLQVEYTHMASYRGDILVEHDVTFDLYRQIHLRERTLSSWWNYHRWLWYERRVVAKFQRVVVMSEKDRGLLPQAATRPIPNGVDLERFRPQPEPESARLLFVGSFRHFPNIVAYRFFTEEVWPGLRARVPGITLTAVAGPEPELYWNSPQPPYTDDAIDLRGFVRDVQPLYVDSNVVIVPTKVSAGTNLKVLEAMAMERAVVSTTSGCAGLGLEHGQSVWIADTAEEFADAIVQLIESAGLRHQIAVAAREIAENQFDWKALGRLQSALWSELLPGSFVRIRAGSRDDLAQIQKIQTATPDAAHWEPDNYLSYDLHVAELRGQIAGFLVSRRVDQDEVEVLNLAVDLDFRRQGIGTSLLLHIDSQHVFLEVRESNVLAQNLYRKLGFAEIGRREKYYDDPVEAAIVMRLSR
ncbi:MAG: ribosomal protein S18-alanine N-acetyltransferase [Bryobacteraceae bacterium]